MLQASGGKGGGIAMKRRKFVQAATGGAVAAAVLGKAAGNTKDLYDYRFPLRDLPLRTLSGSDVTVPVRVIGELRDELQGALLVPGEIGYAKARRVWNGAINRRPGLILQCESAADVVKAVNFAREGNLLTAVRGGGHSFHGNSVCDGGLMIDLKRMDSVRMAPDAGVVQVGPGAVFSQVYREVLAWNRIALGGSVGHVGVAGLTLGGGIGRLVRKHGLACDNVRSFDLVTADGKLQKVSEGENRGLYWALRGGCGNFGVVTNFELRTHPMAPTILFGAVVYPWGQARDVLNFYADFTAQAPEELSAYLFCMFSPDGEPTVVVNLCYSSGRLADGEKAMAPLRSFGRPLSDSVTAEHWLVSHARYDAMVPHGNLYYQADCFAAEFSDEIINALLDAYPAAPSPQNFFTIEHVGGAMSRVPRDATAFAHRDTQYVVEATTQTRDWVVHEENKRWADASQAAVRPHASGITYQNFAAQEGPAALAFEENYARLAQVKAKHDPANLFRMNANIEPGAA